MEDGMNDLRARWIFTVGIPYLLPEGRKSKWSYKKWVGQILSPLSFAVS